MEVHTARFGTLTVAEDEIIRFNEGILGFEGIERYILLPHKEDSPFMFLQAVDDENLAFIVVDPTHFWPDYQVEIGEEDLQDLELKGSDEFDQAVVLAIVTVPAVAREMTANLLAPLVIHAGTGRAKQIVQRESAYSTRHKIADALSALQRQAGNEQQSDEQRERPRAEVSRLRLVQVG